MLKPIQIKMYRAEWAKCKKRLLEAGREASEETRMQIHELVTGLPCSSKDFTNSEFDQVLFYFRTKLHHTGEWDAFLALTHSPVNRCRFAARNLCKGIPTIKSEAHADRYIEGISRQMFKNNTQMLEIEQWRAICTAIKLRAATFKWDKKKSAKHEPDPPYVEPVDESQPF